MMTWMARGTMIASWLYYTFTMGFMWISGIAGSTDLFWECMGFPTNLPLPPTWTLLLGLFVSAFTVWGLGFIYLSVEKIIKADAKQDFLVLSKLLQNIATGLICFWLGYNLLTGLLPILTLMHIAPEQQPEWGWDPLNINIVFVILAISSFAIANAFKRAWLLEDENKHFL